MARIAYEIVSDIETGEILEASYFEWNGPVALCKGLHSRQEMQRANQINSQELQLMQQQLGMQQGQINMVNPTLQSIIANGGMLPSQQAALTSIAMNSLPQQFNNLEGQINNQLVQRGITGGGMAGGGGVANMFGQLGQQEAQAQAGLLSGIQNQKMQGLNQAMGTALNIGGMYGANTGLFNQGGLSALGQGVTAANNADQASTGFWGSLIGGLGAIGGAGLGAINRG